MPSTKGACLENLWMDYLRKTDKPSLATAPLLHNMCVISCLQFSSVFWVMLQDPRWNDM